MYSDTICIKYTRKWRWMQVSAKNKAKWERKTVFSQKRVAFYREGHYNKKANGTNLVALAGNKREDRRVFFPIL